METFVLKMLNACTEWSDFRLILRDFVITLLEFQADTPSLYAEEKQVSKIN